MSLTWGFVVLIASGCAFMWALLAISFAQRAPHGSRRRAAAAAALLVAPICVVLEVWFLALAVGSAWPSLPLVIAAAGALAFAVLVPLMATQTPRLPAETRRRAVTNIAVIIVMCTLIAETFVFKDATWSRWVFPLLVVTGVILKMFERRKSRAA